MRLQGYKVLTFDVVGTLVDSECGMLDHLHSAVPGAAVSNAHFLDACRQAHKDPDVIAYPDDLERVWHAIAPPLGLPDTEALAHLSATLENPFDVPLGADDALCEKPDPCYFAYARGRIESTWGYRQADNLHVAQSRYHDIGIAKQLGIATCWIERRHGQKGPGSAIESALTTPDHHFHTLVELADAVDAGC